MLYILSSTNNVIGKKLLVKYPYPMTLTLFHMIANAIFLYPALVMAGANMKVHYSKHFMWRFLIPLGCGKLLGSIMSHISIWRVSVSYAHTIKASLPIFTVIIARIVHREKQTLPVLLSLVPILIGIGISTITELSFEVYGMLSAIAATFIFSVINVYTKTALREMHIGPLQLLMRVARVALITCLPIWIFVDTPMISQDVNLQESGGYIEFFGTMTLSGSINFVQNVLAFSILNLLSSLSYSVTNATKRILVIVVSVITLKNPVTAVNFMGMMTAVSGVFCYNRAKIHQNAKNAKVLPTTNTDTEDQQYISPRYRAFHRISAAI